jgi:hypothetical protein
VKYLEKKKSRKAIEKIEVEITPSSHITITIAYTLRIQTDRERGHILEGRNMQLSRPFFVLRRVSPIRLDRNSSEWERAFLVLESLPILSTLAIAAASSREGDGGRERGAMALCALVGVCQP